MSNLQLNWLGVRIGASEHNRSVDTVYGRGGGRVEDRAHAGSNIRWWTVSGSRYRELLVQPAQDLWPDSVKDADVREGMKRTGTDVERHFANLKKFGG